MAQVLEKQVTAAQRSLAEAHEQLGRELSGTGFRLWGGVGLPGLLFFGGLPKFGGTLLGPYCMGVLLLEVYFRDPLLS